MKVGDNAKNATYVLKYSIFRFSAVLSVVPFFLYSFSCSIESSGIKLDAKLKNGERSEVKAPLS